MTPTPPAQENEQPGTSRGDQAETIESCPKSWIAWKREAERLAAALTAETQARQEAETDAIGSRDELNILKVKHAADVLARQQAERELKASQDDHATLGRLEARARLRLREKLTLSEQARAQAEQALADLKAKL